MKLHSIGSQAGKEPGPQRERYNIICRFADAAAKKAARLVWVSFQTYLRARPAEAAVLCSECGAENSPAGVGEVVTPGQIHRDQIDRERGTAYLRTKYESALVPVKSLAQKERMKRPTCFISYAWGERTHEQWVEKRLASDLQNAGIKVMLDRWDNAAIGSDVSRFISLIANSETLVVPVGTPQYRAKYENKDPKMGRVVAAEVDLINLRYLGTQGQRATVLPVLLDGDDQTSFPPLMQGKVYADFRREESYFLALFDLILTLYGISFKNQAVAELREVLNPETSHLSSLIH